MNLGRLVIAAVVALGIFFGMRDAKPSDLACPETEYYLKFGDQIAPWVPTVKDLQIFNGASDECFRQTGKSCVAAVIANISTGEYYLDCLNPED